MHRFGDLQGAQRELAAAATRARAQGSVERALSIELALTRVLLDLGRTDEAERLLASIEAAGTRARCGPRSSRRQTVRAELLLAQRALAASRAGDRG